jgi:hypothetical protein
MEGVEQKKSGVEHKKSETEQKNRAEKDNELLILQFYTLRAYVRVEGE